MFGVSIIRVKFFTELTEMLTVLGLMVSKIHFKYCCLNSKTVSLVILEKLVPGSLTNVSVAADGTV